MKIRYFHRLLGSHLTVLLIALLLMFASVNLLLPDLMYRIKVQELIRTGNFLVREELYGGTGNFPGMHSIMHSPEGGLFVKLLSRDHNGAGRGPGMGGPIFQLKDEEWERIANGDILAFRHEMLRFGLPLTVVMLPVDRNTALALAAPVTETEATISDVRRMMGGVLIATLGVVFVVSLLLSRGLQRRVHEMRLMTRQIAEGDYRKRVRVKGNDEVAELAEDLNRMADRLERTQAELMRMDGLRSRFLADISHELKTPLTSIRGFIEALRNGLAGSGERERLYFLIEKETLRLIRLVQSVMELERIRSGQIRLQYRTFSLPDLLESVTDQMKILAEEKHLALILAPTGEIQLAADEDRVRQIVINLVKNAIQFTESGEVRVRTWKDETHAYVEVEDTGIGLTQEQQKEIFERFYKADPSRSVSEGEMGLGLTLAHQLAKAHGGDIYVRSEFGAGSVFMLALPLGKPAGCHENTRLPS